jgi:2'-hydroxyisoflavone reductase
MGGPIDRREAARLAAAAALAGLPGAAALAGVPASRRQPMRILILGGTGFIGPHQVRYALERGHQVTLFNRGRSPHAWPGPVEELLGDRNTGDLAALKGRTWDVAIDNPTTLPFWVRDAGQALRGAVGQYLFVSTISVYARDDTPADEASPLAVYKGADPLAETAKTLAADVGGLYGPLKAASEREAARQFGAATTIVRPGLIAGPGDETDRFTYWPARLARGGEVLAPGDGGDPVQVIDARDLAEWIIRLAETRTTGVFNATGPARPLTMAGLLGQVAAAVGSTASLTWVTAAFLAAQNVQPWSDMPVWVPGQGDTAGFSRTRIDRALAAGLAFRPLADTARDALAWLRAQPAERRARLKAGLTAEREAAVLAAWKAQGGHG